MNTNAEEVRRRLDARRSRGANVDSRLYQQIDEPGSLDFWHLASESEFLALIWQARDDSRLLTPPGRPRTLGAVAERMIDQRYTFDRLASDFGLPRSVHNPDWFAPCRDIYNHFDGALFDFVALTPATSAERNENPQSSWYIYDGAHKTLVLAYRLLAREYLYQPVETLLLSPRRR
jgi:hypothetical protein